MHCHHKNIPSLLIFYVTPIFFYTVNKNIRHASVSVAAFKQFCSNKNKKSLDSVVSYYVQLLNTQIPYEICLPLYNNKTCSKNHKNDKINLVTRCLRAFLNGHTTNVSSASSSSLIFSSMVT